jgi:uncharacterized membrane protein
LHRRKRWPGLLITALFTVALALGYVILLQRYPDEASHPGALLFRLGWPLDADGQKLELRDPRWLGLFICLPYLIYASIHTLTDLSFLQRLVSVTVRLALILILATSLARPTRTFATRRVAVVFAIDVSQSISDEQLAKAHDLVERAWKHAQKSAEKDHQKEQVVRVLTFARRPRPLAVADGAERLPPFERHVVGGDATDIQAALQLGYGLFPAGYLRRLVLISDGHETQGDLLAEAHRAAASAAAGSSLPVFTASFPEAQRPEVMIQAMHLPDKVKVGAPFEVKAEIFSTHDDEVVLRLFQDEFVNGREPLKHVTLKPGKNEVVFKSEVKQAGFVSYRLEMSGAQKDTQKGNNRAVAAVAVRGKPRVLYVEGEGGGAQLALQKALQAEQMEVETRGPHGLPGSVKELEKFDLVILSDVPATYVSLGQMALIEQYVRDLGGGFIMAGGENSFGSGGYGRTRIEKLLPVRFDTEKKRDQAVLAMSLLIDKSGSMAGEKMELAKDAAKATVEIMNSSDLISVIGFDSAPQSVVKMQRAANRSRILNDISRIQAAGGTNILAPLEEAFRELQPINARVKHVILLTDGEAPYSGIPELVDQMASAKITVSAVGVGAGADRRLLQMIAERGNGRFYFTQDASNVPKIFTKETSQVARSALVEEAVVPHVVKQVEMLRGLDMGSAPPLKGYVATKAKPLSEVILVSDYGEPLLARWRQGLGKAVAWTSDVKARWATEWVRWPGYGKFFSQLARDTMRHHVQESFDLRTVVQGDRARVIIDAVGKDDRFINGLGTEVEIIDPDRPNLKRRITLTQTAAGRYEGDFPLDKFGSFMLKAIHRDPPAAADADPGAATGAGPDADAGTGKGKGKGAAARGRVVAESLGTVSLPYPREYLAVGTNQTLLDRVATLTGAIRAGGVPASGSSRPTLEAIFDSRGEEITRHQDLWPRVLQLALALLILDVLLRRVRLLGRRSYRA